MPSPRPAPKPAPPAAAPAAAPSAPVAAPPDLADPLRVPEAPEGISLSFVLGIITSGDSICQTVEAEAVSAAGTFRSGPCLVDDHDVTMGLAIAAQLAIAGLPSTAAPKPAESAPAPSPSPTQPPAAATGSSDILAKIAALPSEWQDYLSQMFAAEYGTQLPGDDTVAITQAQIDFLAALLPQ